MPKIPISLPKKVTLTAAICAIIVLFLAAALILVANTPRTEKKAAAVSAAALPDSYTTGLSPLQLSGALMPPAIPGVPLGGDAPAYLLHRTRKPAWEDEDAAKWFVPTSEASLKELHRANQALVNELLRGSP